MDAAEKARTEALIREAWKCGDMGAAVTRALRAFSPEILGYLLVLLRDEQRAWEVYSDFTEDVVRGMPGFRFDSSARTWLYALARHAHCRYVVREARLEDRLLRDTGEIEVPAVERTPTPPHARTSAREGLERLRRSLKPDDQTLLTLRVDRDLDWNEIARVLAGPDARLTAEELQTCAARVRKRFERIKERLRALATTERILGEHAHG